MTRSATLFAGAALFSLLLGCETLPATIDDAGTVDQYLAQGRYKAACVGLESKNEEIRTYTAQRLRDYSHERDARVCLCDRLYDVPRHKIDLSVGKGLEGTNSDALAECIAPALTDDQLTEEARQNAVQILGWIGAPKSYDSLVGLMKSDPDPAVRALAAGSLRAARSATADLLATMQSDAEAPVRAAAAASLDGHKGDEVQAALAKAALEDPDGAVRAAALAVLAKGERSGVVDQMLCTAMMKDESPAVRVSAIKAFHGTKRKIAIDCLAERIMTPEEAPEVRQAVMDALKASPSDLVKPVLCSAIPVIAKHIDTTIPDADNDTSGNHIVKAQNDRDWEASFDCVSKALGQSGYTCGGKYYLTNWYNALGGKKQLPVCEGLATP